MTTNGFATVLSLLEGAFRETLSAKERKAYWMLLRDQPDEAVQARAIEYARGQQARYGFPKPSDLIAQTITAEDRAELVLAVVETARFEVGPYRDVSFGDSRTHATIERLGGWPTICTLAEDEWKVKRREFVNYYRILMLCSEPVAPQVLVGIGDDSQNAEKLKARGVVREVVWIGTLSEVPPPVPVFDSSLRRLA